MQPLDWILLLGTLAFPAVVATLEFLAPVDLFRWQVALPKLALGLLLSLGIPILTLYWMAQSPALALHHLLGMVLSVALGSACLGWLWRERAMVWAVVLGFAALRTAASFGWIPYSFGIPVAAFLGAFPASWVFSWAQKRSWTRNLG